MSNSHHVWVVDDDRSIRWVLEKSLTQNDVITRSFISGEELLSGLTSETPDVIVSDVRMNGIDGMELMSRVHELHPHIPIIIMTAHSDLDSAVSAFQGGAFDYLPKPFDIDDAVSLVNRAIDHSNEQKVQARVAEPTEQQEIIGAAPAMQGVFRAIGRLSQSNITVLINGESGTGKELVAKALHLHSPRKSQPFIALNMAAIPKDLIESELFGHEKGAFTGAAQNRKGRFEQANEGTLFLDEIGDMPMDTQTRLLRVLADGEFHAVGAYTPTRVNVRIVAATHQDLLSLVKEGKFREDLFHRLNVIRIQLPSLAERREDIPELLNFFLKRAAIEQGVRPKTLKEETLAYLSVLDWPGNVRQLENTCRWISVMASGNEVHINDLPPELLAESPEESNNWEQGLKQWANQELKRGHNEILTHATETMEKTLISAALQFTGGKKIEAAKLLGWGRNTLTRKIKEFEL